MSNISMKDSFVYVCGFPFLLGGYFVYALVRSFIFFHESLVSYEEKDARHSVEPVF